MDVRSQARAIYQRLRQAGHLLVAVMPPASGRAYALRDRLRRAAGLGDDGAAPGHVAQASRGDA